VINIEDVSIITEFIDSSFKSSQGFFHEECISEGVYFSVTHFCLVLELGDKCQV
jgi:hypothetical protein